MILKKILLGITCLFAFITYIQAQTFYGTTANGGNEGGGSIIKYSLTTNKITVAQSFERTLKAATSIFVQASNGKLYGTTYDDGEYLKGTIFSFDPASSEYVKLINFDGINGSAPSGSLVQASNGKLYGMTSSGGINNAGVIFSFDPSSSDFVKLKDLDAADGGFPKGGLMQASDGKLYGMTTYGGSGNSGIIFSFDPASSAYMKLKDFNVTDGAYPYGNLIQANDGMLYGMTYGGGSSGYGIIFSFDPSSLTYIKLKDFNKNNGAYPTGSLIQASNGKLYGATAQGGIYNTGVIFSFDPASHNYIKIKSFNNTNIDNNDTGPETLIQASNGKLYGVTQAGGRGSDPGIIFSFDPSSLTYTRLKVFNLNDEANCLGSLIQARNGKLYGITRGAFNYDDGSMLYPGVIFSYDPSSATYSKVKDFAANTTGTAVSGTLMKATDGKLYGMTNKGGRKGNGVIFSYEPSSSKYSKLEDFDKINGGNPYGGFVQARDGKLYGLTSEGGSGNNGVIFSYDPSSSTYTKLKDFNYTDGQKPIGSLIQASDGKLYGLTSEGGNGDHGVIFSYDPSTSIYTKSKDFDITNGSHPYGSLMQASDGKLYGMTSEGGSNQAGVIFSFDPASSTYIKLKDLNFSDGGVPYSNLIQASDGKLYGLTSTGGATQMGVIFSFDPTSSTYIKLTDFIETNGFEPLGSLMQASNGKLYGIASRGGIKNYGTVFSFDPSSSIYTKLQDFDETNSPARISGTALFYGSAFIEVKDSSKGIAPTVTLTSSLKDSSYVSSVNVIFTATASDTDGTISKVEFYNGSTLLHTENHYTYSWIWKDVAVGDYTITAKAYDNDSNVTTSAPVHISVVPNAPPTVHITSPVDGVTYISGKSIVLSADTSDMDGTIKMVQFYSGSTLIGTEINAPYNRRWYKVPAGDYTITAVATDDLGIKTTSAPVHIHVVPNQPPVVNITSPVYGADYFAPATIILSANASDPDGTIKKVEFYNGTTLLHTENYSHYIWYWKDVPAGTYTIIAKAIDDNGKATLSAPVTITVASPNNLIVSNGSALNHKNDFNTSVSLSLSPNPARDILNVSAKSLKNNNPSTISIISSTGVVMQTVKSSGLNQTTPLKISLLASGVYTVKIINGDKVMNKRFVKL